MKRTFKKYFSMLITSVVAASLLVPVTAHASLFSDASEAGTEFAPYIERLGSSQVVGGIDGKFFPLNNVSRGEFIKMLTLAAQLNLDSTGSAMFSDVPSGSAFFPYVQTAAKMGIVSGFSDGTFKPTDPITRGAAAKMLIGAFSYDIDTTGGPHFSDVSTGHDFYNFIESARNNGLISGYMNGTFRPGDQLIRAHAAKIISIAMGGTGPAKTFPLVFSDSLFPSATAEMGRSDSIIEVSVNRLPSLGENSAFIYEMWAYFDGEYHSGGQFDINAEGEFVNERHQRRSSEFNFPIDIVDGVELGVWIELRDDDTGAGETVMLYGYMYDGQAMLEFPVDLAGSRGEVQVRGAEHNDVTIQLMNLVDLSMFGMRYEAWAETNDGTTTLGTFQGMGAGKTVRHRAIYKDNFLEEATRVIISVEPKPDNATAATNIQPFVATIGEGSSPVDADDDDVAVDEDLYLGLTSEQTDLSIVRRTVMEMSCESDPGVIIQAYSSTPNMALESEAAIVIKVSDCEGNPISDIDFAVDQISGPDGEVSDADEVGTGTGVYVANFTSPDASDVNSSDDEVTFEISQDSASSDDVDVPSIQLTFELESTTSVSSAKTMEVDIPQAARTVDYSDNDSDDNNADMLVLVTILDSAGRNIEDLDSDIEMLSSDDELNEETPDSHEGNLYMYEISVDDIIGDNDDSSREVTIQDEFRLEAFDDSAVIDFLPILRPATSEDIDEFTIEVTIIPEDDENN